MSRLRIAAMALGLVLLACGRNETGAPSPAPQEGSAPASAWSWHPLGDLAVVEGEVSEATELILEGRSIRVTCTVDQGPVRWEFYRPPKGEVAVLRTASGRTLARLEFTVTPKPSSRDGFRPPAPAPMAKAAPRPVPPAPLRTAAVVRPAPGVAPMRTPVRPPSSEPSKPLLEALKPLPTKIPDLLPAWPDRLTAPASPTPHWPGVGEAVNLTRGPGGRQRLLLSFDGGSNAEAAAEVLDTLKARGVRTTFFLTGVFIQKFPALVKRMAAEGHELGNHTLDHPHFAPGMKRDPKWTRERVQKELLDADAALVRLLGRPMDPYWRAPYGEHTAEIRRWVEELGYRHVGWSEGADTLDWATPKERNLYRSGDAILQRLKKRLGKDGDGLIVLMHLGSERVEADRPSAGLGAFMDKAKADGWSFVNAGAFLHDLGKPTWDPQWRLALLRPAAPVSAAR